SAEDAGKGNVVNDIRLEETASEPAKVVSADLTEEANDGVPDERMADINPSRGKLEVSIDFFFSLFFFFFFFFFFSPEICSSPSCIDVSQTSELSTDALEFIPHSKHTAEDLPRASSADVRTPLRPY